MGLVAAQPIHSMSQDHVDLTAPDLVTQGGERWSFEQLSPGMHIDEDITDVVLPFGGEFPGTGFLGGEAEIVLLAGTADPAVDGSALSCAPRLEQSRGMGRS